MNVAREDLGGRTLGESLMAPTRIYVKPVPRAGRRLGVGLASDVDAGAARERANRGAARVTVREAAPAAGGAGE